MMHKPLLLCLFISFCVHLTLGLGLQHVLTLESPVPEKKPLRIRAMPPAQASASPLLDKLPAGPSTALGKTLPVKRPAYPEIKETARVTFPPQPAFTALHQTPELKHLQGKQPGETISPKELEAEPLLAAGQSLELDLEPLPLDFPVQTQWEDENPAVGQVIQELSLESPDVKTAEAKVLDAPKHTLQQNDQSVPSLPKVKDLPLTPELMHLRGNQPGETIRPKELKTEPLLAARQPMVPASEPHPLRLSDPVTALSDEPAAQLREKPMSLKLPDFEPEPAHSVIKNVPKIVGTLKPGAPFDPPAPEIVDRSRTNPALPQPKTLLFAAVHNRGTKQLLKSRSTETLMSGLQAKHAPVLTMKPFQDLGPQLSALAIKQTAATPLPLSDFMTNNKQRQEAACSFVIDTSGSVKGSPLSSIKAAAAELIKLLDDTASVAVLTFDDEVRTLADYSLNKTDVLKKVAKLETSGTKTLLYDALFQALEEAESQKQTKKFILLFSDGKDEGSAANLDQVIAKARQASVPILTIGYSKIEKDFLAALEKLALKTGGTFVVMPRLKELVTVFKIQNLLQKSQKNPENPTIFYNLGLLYYQLKNYQQAELMFSRVTALKPDYLDQSLFNLAMAQKKLGKLEECLRSLRRSHAVNPKNTKTSTMLHALEKVRPPADQTARRQAEKLMQRAREESNRTKAQAMLEEAVALTPENINAWRYLGDTYLDLKKYSKAANALEKALALGAEDSEIFFNLGYLYDKDNKLMYAERMYSRVLSFKPSYLDEVYYNLALVQKRLGKVDESLANLKMALAYNPDNSSARKLLKTMQDSREPENK